MNRSSTAATATRLVFGRDEAGDEVLEMATRAAAAAEHEPEEPVPTRGRNTVVMMTWERAYMEALVDALDLQEADEVRPAWSCPPPPPPRKDWISRTALSSPHTTHPNQKQPAKQVLEIGFGLGYSATAIQRRRPRRHVIIEPDAAVLERARAWASEAQRVNSRGTVEIVPGQWQAPWDLSDTLH
jgi:SAM-dependent methyltransferase